MRGNVILGILITIVFSTSVLTLVFLWMRRKGIAARHEKARNAFTAALASKSIKIDVTDVRTKQGTNGVIRCRVVYGQALYAKGEYHANGKVFVRHYPRPDNDSEWSFWYPATSNP